MVSGGFMNVYPLTFESKVIYALSGLKEQMPLFSDVQDIC